MATVHMQIGSKISVTIPYGDTLDLPVAVSRGGVSVDGNTIAADCEAGIWPTEASALAEKLATLTVAGNVDQNLVISGGDNVPVGTHYWKLKDTTLDREIAFGPYVVTPSPPSDAA